MRLLATLWVVLMVSVTLQAQNITYAEYYFNEEPGLGNGTELSITAAEQVTINETLPISELEDGRHKLFVRARDDNGKWSTVYNRTFLKTTLPDEENPQVTFAEYYFNEETGLIVMDSEYPAKNTGIMHVDYYLGRFRWETMYEDVKLLQLFFALRESMTERPIAAQSVMSNNVTIAGFSFGSGSGDLESNRSNLDMAIRVKIKELQPLRIRSRGDMRFTNPYMSLKI